MNRTQIMRLPQRRATEAARVLMRAFEISSPRQLPAFEAIVRGENSCLFRPLMALRDEAIVGVLIMSIPPAGKKDEPVISTVNQMGVLPPLQGRGIGAALMRRAEIECLNGQIAALALTENIREPLRPKKSGFYERLGYAPRPGELQLFKVLGPGGV
jgi:GNAT superfamily N-acetyltransferase